MSDQKIEVGQIWKRRHDGRLVRVSYVSDWPENDQIVEWAGVGKRGRGSLFMSVFRRRYDLEEPVDD